MEKLAPHIMRSENSVVAAFNFLEDLELAETAHSAIHRAAFMRSGFTGCAVYIKNDKAIVGALASPMTIAYLADTPNSSAASSTPFMK